MSDFFEEGNSDEEIEVTAKEVYEKILEVLKILFLYFISSFLELVGL